MSLNSKKSVPLIIILTLLILLFLTACWGSNEKEAEETSTQDTAEEKPAETKPESKAGSKESPWSYDTAQSIPYGIPVGDTGWNITNVQKASTLPSIFGDAIQANGVFITIDVTVTNYASTEQYLEGDSIIQLKLYDAQGREYTQSDKRVNLEGEPLLYEQLSPGVTVTRTAVFDVAPDASGFVLRVHGWGWSDDEALYIQTPL